MKTKNFIITMIALSTVASIGLVVATDNTTEPPVTSREPVPIIEPTITILPTNPVSPDKVVKTDKKIVVHNPIDPKTWTKNNDTITYANYCPFCNEYNVLIVHDGSYKGTQVEENELSCSICGADYNIANGWEKSGSFRKQLEVIT